MSETRAIEVGDIAIFLGDEGYAAKKGATVRVTERSTHSLQVIWLDNLSEGQMDGSYGQELFELKVGDWDE